MEVSTRFETTPAPLGAVLFLPKNQPNNAEFWAPEKIKMGVS